MATILLAWQAGGGLGHLMNLRPVAAGLVRRGHRVVAVLRDLSPAARRLLDPAVEILQAPFKHQRMADFEPSCTFAHVLHNIGFADVDELTVLADGWRNLYRQINPDLILCEHSPTALLAARGFPVRKALLGNGFYCPSDATPLPNLRAWLRPDPAELLAAEARVLENMNRVLLRWREAPLDRVAQLFQEVDENFLLTLREIDPYPDRRSVEYLGSWSAGIGQAPDWPPGDGSRIYGYLKPFPTLPQLLGALAQLPNPALIVADGIDARMRADFSRPNVRFAAGPVEMSQATEQCDLAILNGSHATTIAMLLAGKPALHVPIFLEQALNAFAAARLGAAVATPPDDASRIVASLQSLLASEQISLAAQSVAARYAGFDPDALIGRVVHRAESLALD